MFGLVSISSLDNPPMLNLPNMALSSVLDMGVVGFPLITLNHDSPDGGFGINSLLGINPLTDCSNSRLALGVQ